jgi:DNA-directed RNA polymerase subunit beta'
MKCKGMIWKPLRREGHAHRVRRKRMGHIETAAPAAHRFFKAMPSRLGNLLDIETTSLEKVIYFQDYVVIDPRTLRSSRSQLLTEEEYRTAREQYGDGAEPTWGRRRPQAARRSTPRQALEDAREELHETA